MVKVCERVNMRHKIYLTYALSIQELLLLQIMHTYRHYFQLQLSGDGGAAEIERAKDSKLNGWSSEKERKNKEKRQKLGYC